ncbi:hypothetical protein [Filimonas effusa]|uniref:Uncharacterized protein n=1 Tax=Filimonas effusa TaxID=2508721 RepID=A0A4Q1D7S8_9BACT|nr:hypothetical protein [Filimonas effusa]RXK85291.1 hypothetical protein ESB13_00230 [Filimonas effusa]
MTVNKERRGFTMENDSVKITYFLGDTYAPPLTIEIVNKLDEPLVIDWQRSAMVYNGATIAYSGNTARFTGHADTYDSSYMNSINPNGYNSNRTHYSEIYGTLKLPKDVEFIPPHASIISSPVHLPSNLVTNIPDTALRFTELKVKYTKERRKAEYALFNASNSPVIIDSYLTLYPNNKEATKAIMYQHRFYASEIVNTKEIPAGTYYMDEQPGYRYYLKGSSDTKLTTTSGAGTGAVKTAGQSTSIVVDGVKRQ